MPINFNFQPIYQRYVGDNSDLVNKILTKKEEEYKLGEEYLDFYNKLQKGMEAAEPLTGQVEAVNKLRLEALNNIKQFTEQGDYENIYNKIKTSAVDMQGKYMPYAEQLKSFQEQLKERMKEDKDWGKYADMYRQQQIEEYNKGEGLQINPVTGQATGFFKFKPMVGYKNVAKELADFASKIPVQTNKTESGLFRYTNDPNSDFYYYDVSTGKKTEIRGADKIAKISRMFLEQSPELKEVVQTQANIDAYNYRKAVENGNLQSGELVNRFNARYDGGIKAAQEEIKNINKNEKDPLKRKNAIESLNEYITNLQESKLKEEDLNSSNFEDKMYNAYAENRVKNTGDLLAVNNLETNINYYTSEYRKHFGIENSKRKIADADAVVSASGSDQMTGVKFGEMFKNVSTAAKDTRQAYTDYVGLLNKTVGVFNKNNTIKQNADIIADKLNKLNLEGGLTDENVNTIINILNTDGKLGINTSPQNFERNKSWIATNLQTIKNLADYKKANDEATYEQEKLTKYIHSKIPNKAIKQFAINNKISETEAMEILTNATVSPFDSTDATTLANTLEKAVEDELILKRNATNFFKDNKLKIDFKDYDELNFTFTNAKEGSTVYELNKDLTNHFKTVSYSNLTLNGIPLQKIMNDGLTPVGEQDEKVVPTNPEIQSAALSNNNKILLTLKDSDGKIFKINVDADESNGNLYEKHLKGLREIVLSKSHDDKLKKYAISAIADDVINKADWGKIINMQNNSNRIITSKNGNTYTIGKKGNSFILTNTQGEPVIKGNPTIFTNLDDLKYQIGLTNIYQ